MRDQKYHENPGKIYRTVNKKNKEHCSMSTYTKNWVPHLAHSTLPVSIRIKRLLRKWSVSLDPRLQPECLPSLKGFPGGASGKEPACQCRRLRDASSVPEWGRFPGGGNGNPLQNFCLENPRGQREELGRQQSMGSQTVGQDWQSMHTVVKNHCSTQPWWVKRSPGERLSHTSYFCKWKTFFMGSFWLCSV